LVQVGADCYLWLLASSCGVAVESILQHSGTVSQAPELKQLYDDFQADTLQLYESSAGTLCLGVEIFHTLHTVLQDLALRLGEARLAQSSASTQLQSNLVQLLQALTAGSGAQASQQMHGACLASLREYFPAYDNSGTASPVRKDSAGCLCARLFISSTTVLHRR
jgi:hypothetical protein